MLRFSTLLLLAVLIAGGSPACEDGRTDREEQATAPVDFGPTAAYERRFLFLGPGQTLPTAAIMDFVALSDSLGLRRGVRARVSDGTDWHQLMDEGWDMARMREPWRLVPHGALRLVMGDAGELAALVFRGDMEVRVEPGSPLAGHSPDPGTQLVLRHARLALGADLTDGVLLDAQLGRGVDPAHSRLAGQPRADDDAEATPAGQPGEEALLMDNDGFFVVFTTAGSGPVAWVHHAGRDDVHRGAHLTAVAWDDSPGGVRVPSAWQLAGPGELTGELSAETVDGIEVVDVPDLEALGYAIVAGWVMDRDVRREVYGLVRHVR
jgi:hypothetical protein